MNASVFDRERGIVMRTMAVCLDRERGIFQW